MWRVPVICGFFCLYLVFAEVSNEQYDSEEFFVHPKDAQDVSPRIVGGDEVSPHSYPSQVALVIYNPDGNNNFCGGSLISNRWVLTAAHCLVSSPSLITVVLGDHNIEPFDSTATMLNTTEYVYHEEYDSIWLQNDVGLVKLPYNITFSDYIKPTAIAAGNSTYAGVNGTVVGWGYESNSPLLSSVLRSVDSVIMSNDVCAAHNIVYKSIIQPMHICLSGDGIVGFCSGDSGGPLFVDGIQVGIVSFGSRNCTAGWPSVFARVTEFDDWINEHAVDDTADL